VTAPASTEPLEAEMVRAVLEAAGIFHWRVAHFRPARRAHGWSTAVQGDGAGFPDLVMLHPRAGVWYVELKTKTGRLSPEQIEWRDALRAAGEIWLLVQGKDGQDRLLAEMAKVCEQART
jgi:VRR-NUC domain